MSTIKSDNYIFYYLSDFILFLIVVLFDCLFVFGRRKILLLFLFIVFVCFYCLDFFNFPITKYKLSFTFLFYSFILLINFLN